MRYSILILKTLVLLTGPSCTYEKVASTMSIDGVLVAGVSSASECETHCSEKTPPCAAFDFNTLDKKCYAHTPASSSASTNFVGIDQYRLEDCSEYLFVFQGFYQGWPI